MSDLSQEQSSEQEEPARPEWLPDNFRSPEDLASSYRQLEEKLREQGAEKNQYQETASQLQARLDQLEASQQELAWQTQQSSLAEQWEMAEPAAQLQIAAAIAQEAAERKYQELQASNTQQQGSPQYAEMATFMARQAMESKYADWQEVAPVIGEIVKADPALFPVAAQDGLDQIVGRLDSLYKLAKAQQAWETGGTALSDLAQAAALAKQQAATVSGTSGPAESTDDYWEAVTKADPGGYH